MSLQSKSTVRFRSNTVTDWATNTSLFDRNEFLLTTLADGTTSPAVRLGAGRGTFAQAVSIGMVISRSPSAIDVTATATAAQVKTGLITSLSAAAVALTLPLAPALAAAIGAVQGTSMELLVDNSAGANTVTVTASASITAATAVVTGGATLTVGSGVVGIFKIVFTSSTVAKIYRIG